jgi:hypothetical protein
MSEKIIAYYNRPKKIVVKNLQIYFYEEDTLILNEIINLANNKNISLNVAMKELMTIAINILKEKELTAT